MLALFTKSDDPKSDDLEVLSTVSNSSRMLGTRHSWSVYRIRSESRGAYSIRLLIECECNEIGDMEGKDASMIEAVELRQEGVVEHGYHHVILNSHTFQEWAQFRIWRTHRRPQVDLGDSDTHIRNVLALVSSVRCIHSGRSWL